MWIYNSTKAAKITQYNPQFLSNGASSIFQMYLFFGTQQTRSTYKAIIKVSYRLLKITKNLKIYWNIFYVNISILNGGDKAWKETNIMIIWNLEKNVAEMKILNGCPMDVQSSSDIWCHIVDLWWTSSFICQLDIRNKSEIDVHWRSTSALIIDLIIRIS